MIQISWLWLPLIITLILYIIAKIFESIDILRIIFEFLCVISFLISIAVYIVVGVDWMLESIVIT